MKNLILILIVLISNTLFAQNRLYEIESYKKFLPVNNTEVKLVVIDKGIAQTSEVTTVREVSIPEDTNVNLVYGNRINYADVDDMPKSLSSIQTSKDWKVIPEILFSKVKGSDKIVSYRIFFTSVSPFQYDHYNNYFAGGLGFVLVNVLDSSNVDNLEEPVYIEVKSQEIDIIQPNQLTVDHLSLPSSEIALTESSGLDSLKIKIITKSNLAGYETYINVEPAISIESSKKDVMGFGVEKIQLDVKTIGSSSSETIQVNFSTESGKFHPKDILLKNNELQSVQLRSGNKLGEIEINAIGKNISDSTIYNSNTLQINYIFPWLFILFSIIGGVIGSLVRFRMKINTNKIFLGMLDGFTASVFYFILKIPIPQLGELDNLGFVVLGIGILGGFAKITMIFPYIGNLFKKT